MQSEARPAAPSDPPLVSVLISTYNRSRVPRRAINSVLMQDFGDFEIVVIDDCSTDDTADVVASFNDRPIRYIRNPTNIGSKLGDRGGLECIKFHYMLFSAPGDNWDELVSDVVGFTDLGTFLELPIRTYSDGMHMRLTAALATSSRRDILLIDEGVGAGDAAFQEKFSARVHSFLQRAGLLVITSHNPELLREYCTRGLVLVHGEIRMLGELEQPLDFYSRLNG